MKRAKTKEGQEFEVMLGWRDSVDMKDMLCPKCFKPFEHFLRHMIKRNFAGFWRVLGRPTDCVICSNCKEIIGYE